MMMPSCRSSLDLYAVSAQLCEHDVDAAFFNRAHCLSRHAQRHPALFSLDPEALRMQVRQEAPPLAVVGVRYPVADGGAFACYFAHSGHIKPCNFNDLSSAPRRSAPRKRAVLYQPCEWPATLTLIRGPRAHGELEGTQGKSTA